MVGLRAFRALRGQRNRDDWLELVTDYVPALIMLVDKDLRYLFVNKAYADFYGYAPADIIGEKIQNIVSENEFYDIKDKLQSAMSGMDVVAEQSVYSAKAERHFYSTRFTPWLNDESGVEGVLAVTTDITSVKISEENLKGQLAYNEYVFKRNPALIVGFDLKGNILSVNPKVCQISGYSEKELLGKNWWSIFFPGEEERNYEKLVKTFREQWEVNDYEMPMVTKTGDTRIISWTSLNRYDENVEVKEIIGFGIDVTERNAFQQQILLAKEEAEEANRTKSDFLANMSHEIRTPMNGIIGTTQLLRETNLDDKQKKYLQIIQGSGRTLLAIINEILDYSKIEAGKFEIYQEPFVLRHCVEETIGLMQPLAQEKGLKILLEYANDIPRGVVGDAVRVRQILTNLIGNAIKFTHEGSIAVRVTLDGRSHGLVMFEVIDTGVGIPENKQDNVFKPFSQIIQKKKDARSPGTGLGLAISKYLAENMGGEIGLMSEEGRGSNFWFTIHFEEVMPDELISLESHNEEDVVRHNFNASVLVVEDVITNQFVITDMLENLGCSVDIAANGQEAINAREKKSYDMILMDCQMPVMDGFEATRALRAKEVNDPIVALTANALKGDREKCLEAGMNDFISKPVDQQEIVRVLNTWLNREENNSD